MIIIEQQWKKNGHLSFDDVFICFPSPNTPWTYVHILIYNCAMVKRLIVYPCWWMAINPPGFMYQDSHYGMDDHTPHTMFCPGHVSISLSLSVVFGSLR